MKKYFNIGVVMMLILLMALSSCTKVVLKISELPSNTPKGSPIYVSGNFNLWDPEDPRYELIQLPDSTYVITLPQIYGDLEYKFTRGDWPSREGDRCGNEILNRIIKTRKADTILHTIECWMDLDAVNCDSVTIVVNKIPENTPKNEPLKIAGSFNAWNPGDNTAYILKKDPLNDRYLVTVPRKSWKGEASPILTYKFIREDITMAEADKFGRELDPRVLNFEKGDSVFVQIEGWNDRAQPNTSFVTIIIPSIPKETPKGDKIFLVGNFNNWNQGDRNYMFTKNKQALYQISIPREKYGLSFKITRGTWASEFVDACGEIIDNQDYNYDEIDTLYYTIEGWKDLRNKMNPLVTIIIDDYPKSTPNESKLFIQVYSKFENFFANANAIQLTKESNGNYSATINRNSMTFEYVITRGSYATQEIDNSGLFVEPRLLTRKCIDTVYLKVENWNDLFADDKNVVLKIINLPRRTPEKDDLYIAGQFNGWDPGDRNYKLKKNEKGYYTIQLPKRWLIQGYKITRGNWQTVEGNKLNLYRDNRIYEGTQAVVEIEIEGWEDRSIF